MPGPGYNRGTIPLLLNRASCRNFSLKKIPARVLERILQAGCHGATGGNLQPYSIIKVLNQRVRRRLASLCGQDFIGQAPVNLLFCIDWHRLERWADLEHAPFTATQSFRHFWISFQDTIICSQNICTAADSQGLGSVYIGTVLEIFPTLKRMFRLPRGVFPVVLLCLGYPKGKLIPRRKLGPEIIVHPGRYRQVGPERLRKAFERKYGRHRLELTADRLREICEASRRVHGPAFAEKVRKHLKNQGYINRAQYYFGLHYRADEMPEGNEKYLKIFKEFGFGWFERYRPQKKPKS